MVEESEQFNPRKHTGEEVSEYLAGVDAEEVARVREIEEATQNRKNIEWPDATASGNDDADAGQTDPQADQGNVPGTNTATTEGPPVQGDPPAPSGDPNVQIITPEDDEDDVEESTDELSDRPVWNVETHGKPSAAQREFYKVVGG